MFFILFLMLVQQLINMVDIWSPRNKSPSQTLLSLARVLALKEQPWEKVIFVIFILRK